MSQLLPVNTISLLWEEILKQHWDYSNSDESKERLEIRKILEDRIREFLCVIRHDRKFFLPQTAKVLESSIRNLENFSAQKAITAFESISQYANNLFAKPWRKEFRMIKMYSGFYQHEIKSNILEAEILFEAMGYRRSQENVLILEGPICPDEVVNVSRDAMIAYVELQIIKHIYAGLESVGVKCSLLDIYHYREKFIGEALQAVKAIAYSCEEKRFRPRQKALVGDSYSYDNGEPSSNYLITSTRFCPPQCQCNIYQQVPPSSRCRVSARPNATCGVSSTKKNVTYSNMSYPTQHHYLNHHQASDSGGILLPQMSHSRSLEHYSESNHKILAHGHSFDHQQLECQAHHRYHHPTQPQICYQGANQSSHSFYESPYDCIDGNSVGGGGSTISYTPVDANAGAGPAGDIGINCTINSSSSYSHPYNVSRNRFPLPVKISKELFAYENLQSSHYNGSQEPTYDTISDRHMYSSISKLPQTVIKNTNTATNVHGMQNRLFVEDSIEKKRCCRSEQLINFEDPTILQITNRQQQFHTQNPYSLNFESYNHSLDKHCNMSNILDSTLPATTTSNNQPDGSSNKIPTNESYIYARPTPRENCKENAFNLRKYRYNSGELGENTDMSYESANDEFGQLPNGNDRNQQNSHMQFLKNQDGVGSGEYWTNIYRQKIEKNCHSKDFVEEKDLLVESLDLNSLNINNDTSTSQSSLAEKRRSYYSEDENQTENQLQQSELKQKKKTFDNLSQNSGKMENSFCTNSSANNTQKTKISMDNNSKKMKSAFKQSNTTSKHNLNINKSQSKTNDNTTLSKAINNNNNEVANSGNRTMNHKKLSSSVSNTTKKPPSLVPTNTPPHLTQDVIVTSENEWGCSFCTFLNPNENRICEMCAHTKDFTLDSSKSSTAIAHNTTTCA